MALKDRISHAAAVTKWKTDQQMRLLRVQNQIREIEGQIRAQKSELADTALSLYREDDLTEEELKQICSTIAQLHEQINAQQSLQEDIKRERPPELDSFTPSYPTPVDSSSISGSGLICPQCGQQLHGQYCPEHGVEGVLESPIKEDNDQVGDMMDSEKSEDTSVSGQLICPICKRTLDVQFCPEHGVEGVPA